MPARIAPVAEPALARGSDARLALARERQALREANGRIRAARSFYDAVRVGYAGAR